MTRRPPLALLLGLLVALPACGHRGDPRPPLRKTPTQPGGFRLAQRGDAIELRANAPSASVDGLPYDAVIVEFLHVEGLVDLEKTGTHELVRATPGSAVQATIPLPAPGTLLRAAARSLARGEKSARTLTQALVAQPPLEAPRELTAHVVEDGIALAWKGIRPQAIPPPELPGRPPVPGAPSKGPVEKTAPLAAETSAAAKPANAEGAKAGAAKAEGAKTGEPKTGEAKTGEAKTGVAPVEGEVKKKPARPNGFFVYRRTGGAPYLGPLAAEPLELRNEKDDKAPLGAKSCYVVRAVGSTSPLIESAPSNEVCLTMRDITPPLTPVGLTVMPRPEGLELLWSPSGEGDLAGYRVYRSAPGGPPEKLQELPPGTTSYLDASPKQGARYLYSLSAFDTTGNESTPCEPVTAALP